VNEQMPLEFIQVKLAIGRRMERAQAAVPGPWHFAPIQPAGVRGKVLAPNGNQITRDVGLATACFMALNDPQRILHDVNRDVLVMERHSPYITTFPVDRPPYCRGCGQNWPCPDFLDLAQEYGVRFEYDKSL